MKILFFGITNIGNVGDNMLVETTEWLVNNIEEIKDVNVKTVAFYPAINDLPLLSKCLSKLWRPFRSLIFRSRSYKLKYLNFFVDYYWYYRLLIKDNDRIVLPIGMLKYATQEFSYGFDLITSIANKYNKPVLFSAMSIALSDQNDWRYRELVKAVNRSCVKIITTRDGEDGVQLLKEQYLNSDIESDYVGDPALWIPETYGYSKNVNFIENKIIGINLIRKDIYSDYNEGFFESEKLAELYKGIVSILEAKGYEWEFFCNGMQSDYEFGQQLIKELNLPNSKLRNKPESGKQLVEIISHYRCVFGARLHACITSVALGIPVSGLLWDKKLHYFSKTMGIRQFFSETQNLNASAIVEKMELAMKYDFDFENRNKFKIKTKESICQFLISNYK